MKTHPRGASESVRENSHKATWRKFDVCLGIIIAKLLMWGMCFVQRNTPRHQPLPPTTTTTSSRCLHLGMNTEERNEGRHRGYTCKVHRCSSDRDIIHTCGRKGHVAEAWVGPKHIRQSDRKIHESGVLCVENAALTDQQEPTMSSITRGSIAPLERSA